MLIYKALDQWYCKLELFRFGGATVYLGGATAYLVGGKMNSRIRPTSAKVEVEAELGKQTLPYL